ncbi:Dimer_Tnp_hAT domain-containing protein [Cephalotus follicularis]|uniref:Dimer_Tnp_hAT domain-containing protein n=1 Tax=Cephalotus follicularis TaxID=3775 RepID=A0A1Q3C426_CEPFO|nr:Dimer_Tnp_hAT domain-containing protein [Cephalotus follicularis]
MDEKFVAPGRSRRNVEETTNLHHFRVEVFYSVIDLQIRELNDRFNEVNTELLICMACLDPSYVFSAFDKQKLIRLAKFYPSNFSPVELMVLESQLGTYILDVRSRAELSNVMGIGELAIKLVKLKMDDTYPLVYLLVKLALLLPVATATVERAFSSMKIMKTRLRNRMGDEWMNDSLVAYIERGILKTIDNDTIMNRFQNMKTRRGVL